MTTSTPEVSVGDLRVLIRGRLSRFDLAADNALVEEAARIAFEIIRDAGAASAPQELETLKRYNAELSALRVRQNTRILRGNAVIEGLVALVKSEPRSRGKAYDQWRRDVQQRCASAVALAKEQPEDFNPDELR